MNKQNLQQNNTNLSQIKTTIENLPAGVDWTDSTTITPTTSPQTIPPYVNKEITIEGDEDLLPENIAQNVSIFGVTGTLEKPKPIEFTYSGQYQFIENPPDDSEWHLRLTTSGNLNFVRINTKIMDVFCVGGGGGGAETFSINSSGGGGGGYTATKFNVSVSAGTQYPIVIGAGGSGGVNYNDATAGGATKALGVTAQGGSPGQQHQGNSGNDIYGGKGGDGGSGGGGGGAFDDPDSSRDYPYPGSGGTGQKSTTYAFQDERNGLFSGGGGGGISGADAYDGLIAANGGNGGSNGADGTKGNRDSTSLGFAKGGNGGGGSGAGYSTSARKYVAAAAGRASTGGGGGGGAYVTLSHNDSVIEPGANGGSGIVILRGRNS